MKKEYKLILVIIIFTVGLLWFEIPLEYILDQYFTNHTENELLAKIIVQGFIFLALFCAVKKLGLSTFNGFNRKPRIRNKSVLAVPIFLIVIGLWGNWATYSNADNQLLALFSISVLFVGLVEEMCFRGLILPLFINSKWETQYALYSSVLLTAILFGFLHYNNLLDELDNFWGVTSQVFFGVSIGVVFGALMLRTGNVFVVGVCHAFVNLILGNRILEAESAQQIINNSPKDTGFSLISLIGTAVIFCSIALIGLNMIRRVDKTEIEMELESLKI